MSVKPEGAPLMPCSASALSVPDPEIAEETDDKQHLLHPSQSPNPTYQGRRLLELTETRRVANLEAKKTTQLKVATWNTWLIPVQPLFPGCLDRSVPTRAVSMMEYLRGQVYPSRGCDPQLDVICLQEVWSRHSSFISSVIDFFSFGVFGYSSVRDYFESKMGWHVSERMGAGMFSLNAKLFDSGLVIASRFPILLQDHIKYAVTSGGSDWLACKGAVAVCLGLPGLSRLGKRQLLIVSTTHLDSGGPETAETVKFPQIRALTKFMADFEAKVYAQFSRDAFEVVGSVATGDWNVDGGILAQTDAQGPMHQGMTEIMHDAGFKDCFFMDPSTATDLPPQDLPLSMQTTAPNKHAEESSAAAAPASADQSQREEAADVESAVPQNGGSTEESPGEAAASGPKEGKQPQPESPVSAAGSSSSPRLDCLLPHKQWMRDLNIYTRYGFTNDQSPCVRPQRLDHVWVRPGQARHVGHGVAVQVQDPQMWRADLDLRLTLEATSTSRDSVVAVTESPEELVVGRGTAAAAARLSEEKRRSKQDLLRQKNRYERMSDHGMVTATFSFVHDS